MWILILLIPISEHTNCQVSSSNTLGRTEVPISLHETSMPIVNRTLTSPYEITCLLLTEFLYLPTHHYSLLLKELLLFTLHCCSLLVKMLFYLITNYRGMLHKELLEMVLWYTVVCNPMKWVPYRRGTLRLLGVVDMRGRHLWSGCPYMIRGPLRLLGVGYVRGRPNGKDTYSWE